MTFLGSYCQGVLQFVPFEPPSKWGQRQSWTKVGITVLGLWIFYEMQWHVNLAWCLAQLCRFKMFVPHYKLEQWKEGKKLKQSTINMMKPCDIFSVNHCAFTAEEKRGFALQVNQKSITLIPNCCLFWPLASVTVFTSESPKPYSKYQFKSYLIYGKVTENVFVFDWSTVGN